jgi:threonine dehydrogenase-like Zn-dependent dehydrogenase
MAEMVRAAVQTAPRKIEIQEFPRPTIGADDGLLRIEANGICGSDVEQYKGHLFRGSAVVPGHEPLGIIEEIGDKAAERWGVSVGDRVALEILVPCHHCQACITGRYQACPRRAASHGYTPITQAPSLWGGLAEYTYLAPGSIVHPVSKDLPAEVAVMFNPLAAGVRWAVHLGGAEVGSTVLVLGAGQRGLAAVIAAKAAGAGTVIVTGLSSDAHKLELARQFGADHTIVVDEEDTVARVLELTDGVGVDIVLELTPMALGPVGDALAAARHGGRIVLAGLKGGRMAEISPDHVINRSLTLVGAYGVDSRAYAESIRIIESGRAPVADMHTHSVSLDDTEAAIQLLAGERPGEPAIHVSVHPSLSS